MKRIVIILSVVCLVFACSETPDEIIGPKTEELSVDSLLEVIDFLGLLNAKRMCIIDCFRATFDSLNYDPYCQCGY